MAENRSGYRTEVLTDRDAFQAVIHDWHRLHGAVHEAGPFSDADWLAAWAEVFWDAGLKARIILVWEGADLVGALPLRLGRMPVSRRLPLRVSTLQMLYDDRVGFHDLLIRPGHEAPVAALLYQACRATGAAYMDLTPMRVTPAWAAFRDTARARWSHERREIRTVFADLSEGWDAFYKRRSKNEKKSFRYTETQMKKLGAVVCRECYPDDVGHRFLDDIFKVSGQSWKAIHGTDIGSQETDRAFFRGLFQRFGPRGAIRLQLIYVEGKPVANSITFRLDDIDYGLMCDYDDAYAKSGVGRHMMLMEIQDAIHCELRMMDFLRDTHFTSRWADDEAYLMRLRAALRPGLARWIISGEFAARALVERVMGEKKRLTGRRKILGDRT